MSRYTLNGTTALVIGGSGGIGKAVCRFLLERGATVWLHGRTQERVRTSREELLNAAAEWPREGIPDGEATPVEHSPTHDTAAQRSLMEQQIYTVVQSLERADDWDAIIRDVESPDICVIAFGPYQEGAALETSSDTWREMYELNTVLPARIMGDVVPDMVERGFGRVVAFGGTGTDRVRGYREIAAYSAAKTALGVLLRSAALSVGKANVTVNGVCPGMVDTEYLSPEFRGKWARRMPSGSLIAARSVAEAVGFFLDPENRSSNGVLLPIDEGLTVR